MTTLRYFMWPWQELFWGAAVHIAQRLIRPLDPQLQVDAFLLGFRAQDDAAAIENICVSPEDCRFRPEVFAGVPDLVEQLASDDPRSGWRCSAPSSPDQHRQMALSAAWPKAVEQTLLAFDEKSAFFASEPVLVNGYLVLVIVQADRARFEMHYRLTRDFVQKVQIRYSVGRSLIETTVRAYLDALADTLQRPEPGRDPRLIGDDSAVWRAAAKQLMRGPAWAGGDLMGLGDIYDICNTISLQNYEGAKSAGQLVFVRMDHPSIKIDLKLRTLVSIHDCGAVRKLLQMGSGRLCLFCDSRDVYGLGAVGQYDGSGEDLFVVRFLKRFTWEPGRTHQTPRQLLPEA